MCVNLRDLGREVHLRSHTTDISVLAELVVNGGYERLLEHVTEPPRTIVDLGANIGLASRWFLSQWPDAQLVAVEPEPGNIAVLKRNLQRYAATTRIYGACIGARQRTVSLLNGGGEWAFRMTDDETGSLPADRVDVITMNRIIDDLGSAEIDLLKCDIEGAERELFGSCADWINRVRLIVVECHDAFRTNDLLRLIASNGGSFELLHQTRNDAFSCEVAILRRVDPEAGPSPFSPGTRAKDIRRSDPARRSI